MLCFQPHRFNNNTFLLMYRVLSSSHDCLSLSSAEHQRVLSLLAAFCLVLIYFLIQRRCSWVSKVALALGLLGVYNYRAAVGNVLFPWQHPGQNVSK